MLRVRSRRQPKVIEFDPRNDLHKSLILQAASIRLRVLGVLTSRQPDMSTLERDYARLFLAVDNASAQFAGQSPPPDLAAAAIASTLSDAPAARLKSLSAAIAPEEFEKVSIKRLAISSSQANCFVVI